MKDRLKQLRKELRLTQQEFADQLGVSRNNIASYETGKSNLGESVIALISRAFNVNETWLRTGEGEMFLKINRDNQIAMWMGQVLSEEEDSFKKRLLNVLRKLDESQWITFEAYAKELFAEEGNNKDEGKN